MQHINSVQNPIIKYTVSLHHKKNRQEARLFIIEGYKFVKEALKSGLKIKYIFINALSSEKIFPDFEHENENVYLVNEKVIKKISTTDTPCEILAVTEQPEFSFNDIIKKDNPLLILLESVKDPGNLGAIIRTAKATKVSAIILTSDSADIYNPKTVRASAGNLWKIPIIYIDDKTNLRQKLSIKREFQYISANAHAYNSKNYFDVNYKHPTVIFFGSESQGITKELESQSDFSIKIPMDKDVESLNLSISAGVILYEAFLNRNSYK